MKRVLIASASAGNGHIKAAEAVQQGFKLVGGDSVETLHIDVFDRKYSNPVVAQLYGQGYITMVNELPTALGIMYDAMDKPWGKHGRRLGFRKLRQFMLDFDPDLIVSTHFIPAAVASSLLCKGLLDVPSAIVVTDFDAHGMWFCRHYDHYFVAMGETKEYLAQNGIEPDRITISGIPIHPIFAQNKDRLAMRQKHGILQDRPVILLSAGGFGVGPMEKILQALLQVQYPLQVLAMCGKNEELKRRLEATAGGLSSQLKLLPIGYTNQMDEFMSAADILLGKPGGLTTSEALAKKLGFVIVNPIPGQEERNADHLLEEGVALRSNEMVTLGYKLNHLLADPQRLANMQANAARIAHPNASEEIVRTLLKLPRTHSATKCGARHCRNRKVA